LSRKNGELGRFGTAAASGRCPQPLANDLGVLQAFVGEKLGAMFQRPQDENRDDVPWFMRYGARALGTFGGGSESLIR